MTPPQEPTELRGENPRGDAPPSLSDVMSQWKLTWKTLVAQWESFTDVATLEARLAALSLVEMLVLGIISAVLLIASWIGILAVIGIGLNALGLPWALALILLIAGNLGAVAYLVMRLRRRSENLAFKGTRSLIGQFAQSPNNPD
ncbi:NfeD family protein [Pokkaliibacter sp. CJK22405]|uniref:NfeD family protein n=1 Tax=Pokkaliibacter sp. CJK22405 TaxID=3384615 RepID=UPI003984B402